MEAVFKNWHEELKSVKKQKFSVNFTQPFRTCRLKLERVLKYLGGILTKNLGKRSSITPSTKLLPTEGRLGEE